MTAIQAYLRVSTGQQAASGLGLEAQRASIETWCAARGLQVANWHIDTASGKDHPATRDGFAEALISLALAGNDGLLIAARLDRFCRSTRDLLWVRDRAAKQGWAFVAADGSVDTTTPHGRFVTTSMSAVAELEADLIASRTREAMGAAKARGMRFGAPVLLAQDVRERIFKERKEGRTYPAIAADLNAEGVRTATGKSWSPTGLAKVVNSVALDQEAAMRARVARVAKAVS